MRLQQLKHAQPVSTYLQTKSHLDSESRAKEAHDQDRELKSLAIAKAKQPKLNSIDEQQKEANFKREVYQDIGQFGTHVLSLPEDQREQAYNQGLDFYQNALGVDVSPYKGRMDLLPMISALGDESQRELAIKKIEESMKPKKGKSRMVSLKGSDSPIAAIENEQGRLMDSQGNDITDQVTGFEGKPSTVVNVGTEDGRQQPTKKSLNDIQSDLMSLQKTMRDLNRISDTYSDDYLTTSGRVKASVGAFSDKVLNADPAGIATFNAEGSQFKSNVMQFFNEYRKYITGAAASEKELKQIEDSIFSNKIGPREFKSRFTNFMAKVADEIDQKQTEATKGIDVGGKKSSFKGNINGQEIEITEDDIQATMAEEGVSRAEVMQKLGVNQ